jgi:DDE superfamily endonuclease
VFADESGVSTLPPLGTTWAPRGHTPRLVSPGRRRWLSLAGFICYHAGRDTVLVHYTHRRKAFDTDSLIDALRGLRRFLMAPVVLVWDNLGAHHSADMCCFLATQSRWLRVHALPSYAYDLNPAERWRCLSASVVGLAVHQGQPPCSSGVSVGLTGLARSSQWRRLW